LVTRTSTRWLFTNETWRTIPKFTPLFDLITYVRFHTRTAVEQKLRPVVQGGNLVDNILENALCLTGERIFTEVVGTGIMVIALFKTAPGKRNQTLAIAADTVVEPVQRHTRGIFWHFVVEVTLRLGRACEDHLAQVIRTVIPIVTGAQIPVELNANVPFAAYPFIRRT